MSEVAAIPLVTGSDKELARPGFVALFRRPGVLALLVGLTALAIYVRTLCISIGWGDSPELTTAAYYAGVPHPTGYPTYMLLGHLFLKAVPFGSVAYRMNLLSALSAAGAVALLCLLAYHLTRSRPAAVLAALLFAFSRTFWSQAVIAEVYAFHLLLTTATLLAVLQWDRTGSARWLRLTALLYGLSFTHHLTSVLLAPALIALALTSPHRAQFVRELKWNLPLFLAPLLIYAYLPWAALRDTPANWGDPRNLPNLLDHVSGKQYRASMFSKDLPFLAKQFGKYVDFLRMQFNLPLLAVALLGIGSLLRRQRRVLLITVLLYAANVFYSINYDIYDIEVYYLVSHLVVAVWIGCGFRQIGGWLALLWRRQGMAPPQRARVGKVLAVAMLVIPGSFASGNWSTNDRSQDWSALTYARAALQALKPNAVVFAAGDDPYFPLLYVRYVEKRRTDVTIVSIYSLFLPERLRLITRQIPDGLVVNPPECYRRAPRGFHDDNCLLTQMVQDNLEKHPVYVLGPDATLEEDWMTSVLTRYHQITTSNVPFLELRTTPAPVSVAPRAGMEPRAVFRPAKSRDTLELLAYQVQTDEKDGVPWYHVKYLWRAANPKLAEQARVRVLFADEEGSYTTREDGVPEFHNNHFLGQMRNLKQTPLPTGILEEYDVYVPPTHWGKELYLWVGVVVGEDLLRADGQEKPYVRMGALPVVNGKL